MGAFKSAVITGPFARLGWRSANPNISIALQRSNFRMKMTLSRIKDAADQERREEAVRR